MKGTGTIFFLSFVLMANLQNTESKKMSIEEIREALAPLRKHCIERVGADLKIVENAEKGNFVSDRKLQCYFKCMMMNTKVMKNDKIVEKAVIKIAENMLTDDLMPYVTKTMESCHSVAMKTMDGCQLAYDYIKCCYDANPELVIFS